MGDRRGNSMEGSAGGAVRTQPPRCWRFDDPKLPAEQKKWLERFNEEPADCGLLRKGGDDYFDSYGRVGIHEDMIKDYVRTSTYERAIVGNKHLFKDKIVLDVGSGTGILSLFAAKAGAAHVYGIERSEMVQLAEKIRDENGYTNTITYIKGKAEEVELPVDKVDIIISEWMGYFLLFEAMLDTVLFCRDKWLATGGSLFPDRARLFIAGIEDEQFKNEKLNNWTGPYGFNLTALRPLILREPVVDVVHPKAVVTSPCCLVELDLAKCQVADLEFLATFDLRLTRRDKVHAFVCWFDVTFAACHTPITFSTGPASRRTHWKQTVFYISEDIPADKGKHITGTVMVKKNKNSPRDCDVGIHYKYQGTVFEDYHAYRIG